MPEFPTWPSVATESSTPGQTTTTTVPVTTATIPTTTTSASTTTATGSTATTNPLAADTLPAWPTWPSVDVKSTTLGQSNTTTVPLSTETKSTTKTVLSTTITYPITSSTPTADTVSIITTSNRPIPTLMSKEKVQINMRESENKLDSIVSDLISKESLDLKSEIKCTDMNIRVVSEHPSDCTKYVICNYGNSFCDAVSNLFCV